jgi:hypothetical protein
MLVGGGTIELTGEAVRVVESPVKSGLEDETPAAIPGAEAGAFDAAPCTPPRYAEEVAAAIIAFGSSNVLVADCRAASALLPAAKGASKPALSEVAKPASAV